MTPESGESPRRFTGLKTLVAMAWFSAMFFLLGPWLALRASGTDVGAAVRSAPLGAWGILALAVVLVVCVVVVFVRNGDGTPVPLDPPRRFVQHGVWALSRNPMYLAYVLVVACQALALGSAAVALYAAVFFGLIHVYVWRVEEPGLQRRFGAAYERYCEQVPRWLSVRSVRRALARPSR